MSFQLLESCQNLDLFFCDQKGFYIDYKTYYTQPGANVHNIKLFKKYMSSYFGFGVQLDTTFVEFPNHKFDGEKFEYRLSFIDFDDFIRNLSKKTIGNETKSYFPFEILNNSLFDREIFYVGVRNYTNERYPLQSMKLISYKIPTETIICEIRRCGLNQGVEESMKKKYGDISVKKYYVGQCIFNIGSRN